MACNLQLSGKTCGGWAEASGQKHCSNSISSQRGSNTLGETPWSEGETYCGCKETHFEGYCCQSGGGHLHCSPIQPHFYPLCGLWTSEIRCRLHLTRRVHKNCASHIASNAFPQTKRCCNLRWWRSFPQSHRGAIRHKQFSIARQ